MADLPKTVHIVEEGPREGFQFERQVIPTARKIELIEALAETGLDAIQAVSFVDPRRVPGGPMRMPWWRGCARAMASRTPRSG
jgi:hydroxymethylglutaryl-CoA lyase